MVAQASGVPAPGTPRVVVAQDAVGSGDPVRLRDVATIDGDTALGDVIVGRAPAAGELRILDGGAILAALHHEVGDLDRIRYTIPAQVRVRRATQEVSEAAIRDVVEAFIAENMGTSASDAIVRDVEVPGPARIPAGAWTAHVVPQGGGALVGRVRLQVDLVVDERLARSVNVTADVGLNGPVVMAARPVARGAVITDADVTIDRRDVSQMPRNVLGDPAAVIGHVARAALSPWTPIRREQIVAASAVHRGDVVLLVAQRGGLRITTPGEVREDAAAGEPVRVVNRASQKSLVGRVVDGSTVAVEF
jgi:flagella basal body P-ring formation protein FlgA